MSKKGYFDKLMEAVDINTGDQEKKLTDAPPIPTGSKFRVFSKNVIYQADLIYMPDDNGFKYILTVVDVGNNTMDAVALKGRTGEDTIEGFEAIFRKNKHISRGDIRFLYCDSGTEFKNEVFKKYAESNSITLRFAMTARKNQMAVVEYFNFVLTKVLQTKGTVEELKAKKAGNEPTRKWVTALPRLVDAVNEHNTHAEKNSKYKIKDFFQPQKITAKDWNNRLQIGDYVHYRLQQPKDHVTGEKMIGKFRNGDLRYSADVKKIVDITLIPNQPMRYFLEGLDNVTFQRAELLKATDDDTKVENEKEIKLKTQKDAEESVKQQDTANFNQLKTKYPNMVMELRSGHQFLKTKIPK